MFKGIDFKIGSFVVDYLNFMGIFMSITALVIIVISNIHLPKIALDLKFVEKEEPKIEKSERICDADKTDYCKDDTIEKGKNNYDKSLSTKLVFPFLLANKTFLLLCIVTIVSTYSCFSIDVLLHLIVYDLLNWSQLALCGIFFVYNSV